MPGHFTGVGLMFPAIEGAGFKTEDNGISAISGSQATGHLHGVAGYLKRDAL